MRASHVRCPEHFRIVVACAGASVLLTLSAASSLAQEPAAPAASSGQAVFAVRRVESFELRGEAEGGPRSITIRGVGFKDGIEVMLTRQPTAEEVVPETILVKDLSIHEDGDELEGKLSTPLRPGRYRAWVRWPKQGPKLCSPRVRNVREPLCRQETIYFDKDQWELKDPSTDRLGASALRSATLCLARQQPREIVALGFASREGTLEKNQWVSIKRADAVAAAIRFQLPQVEVHAHGLGQALPTQLGDDESAAVWNRRVLLVSRDKRPPCQSVRLGLQPDGAPLETETPLFESAVRCLVRHDVTTTLLAISKSSRKPEVDEARAARTVEVFREQVRRAGGDPAAILGYAVLGSEFELKKLAKVFGMAQEMGKGDTLHIVPTSRFASASTGLEVSDAELGASCHSEAIEPTVIGAVNTKSESSPPQPLPPDTHDAEEPRGAAVQLRLGYLRNLEQPYLGGGLRVGGELTRFFGNRVYLYAGGEMAIFGAGQVRQYSGGLMSNIDFGMRGVIAGGVVLRPVRVELGVVPGLVLPVLNAVLVDAEGTVAYALSKHLEILGTMGGGVALSGNFSAPRFYYSMGAAWWL